MGAIIEVAFTKSKFTLFDFFMMGKEVEIFIMKSIIVFDRNMTTVWYRNKSRKDVVGKPNHREIKINTVI